MKLARITVIALAALATPLAASASEEQKPASSAAAGATVRAQPSNGGTLTQIESIRYGRSERSDPNWSRVEARR